MAAVPPGFSACIRAPPPAYDLRPRSRHLDPGVAQALLEEVEVLQTPSRKRAATMGTGASPASKVAVAQEGLQDRRAVQSAFVVPEAAAAGSGSGPRFLCPFAGCVQSSSRGAGWEMPGGFSFT